MANTLYIVAYPSAQGAPTAAQIVAGQDNTSSAAAWAGNAVWTGAGQYLDSSGLSASTSYKASAVIYDGVSEYSNVVTSDAWSTTSSGVSGTLAVSESGSDSIALTGIVRVMGSLATSEAGSDSASLAGDVFVSGAFSASESGSDSASFLGSGATPPVVGAFDILESGTDSIGLAGKIIVAGVLAASETADSSSFGGKVVVTGALAAAESGNDTASFSVPGVTTLTAADLAAIDALIVARIADIAAAVLAAAQATPIEATSQDRVIEGSLTEAEALRIMLAALAGKVTKSGTNIKFKSVDGLTDRIDGTVDDLGNRTAVTLNGG